MADRCHGEVKDGFMKDRGESGASTRQLVFVIRREWENEGEEVNVDMTQLPIAP